MAESVDDGVLGSRDSSGGRIRVGDEILPVNRVIDSGRDVRPLVHRTRVGRLVIPENDDAASLSRFSCRLSSSHLK